MSTFRTPSIGGSSLDVKEGTKTMPPWHIFSHSCRKVLMQQQESQPGQRVRSISVHCKKEKLLNSQGAF